MQKKNNGGILPAGVIALAVKQYTDAYRRYGTTSQG